MIYTIKSDRMTVAFKSAGGELTSICAADGTEYLWQGDPDIWAGQAPNLFPYIGRLTDETYTVNGETYHMARHGFIKKSELEAVEVTDTSVTLELKDNEMTRKEFPFSFTYQLRYSVEGSTLTVHSEVTNTGDKTMYFGIGAHPGFRVPLEEGLAFEDYVLEFAQSAQPDRVYFADDCQPDGSEALYPLENGRRIALHHDLFDRDAIVLKHACRTVKICSDKGSRAVEVSYPDYPVVGFWHAMKKEAPYVCVEPWSSLPSRSGIVEEFTQQSDLIALDPGEAYTNDWTVRII